MTPKYSGMSAQLTVLGEKSLSLGQHFVTIRDCADESCEFQIIFCLNDNDSNLFIIFAVIHVFDLIPGASRQNEPSTCHTKTIVKQISVSRAGSIDDQYLVFVDRNRDLFCTSLRTDTNFEIYKIGLFPYIYYIR